MFRVRAPLQPFLPAGDRPVRVNNSRMECITLLILLSVHLILVHSRVCGMVSDESHPCAWVTVSQLNNLTLLITFRAEPMLANLKLLRRLRPWNFFRTRGPGTRFATYWKLNLTEFQGRDILFRHKCEISAFQIAGARQAFKWYSAAGHV
jgi:hypothetical protein